MISVIARAETSQNLAKFSGERTLQNIHPNFTPPAKHTMQNLLQQIQTTLNKGILGHEEEIRNHLQDYVKAGHTDWTQYRLFAPCKYSRNLVEISKDFECIVICWDDNQESPIHNHTAQNCWFAVLEGNIEEVYYTYDEKMHKVTEGERSMLTCGKAGWIKDDIALHKVRSVGGKACTLHIYSKPIPFCDIYDPISGEVARRKSGFFSVKGLKQCIEGTSTYLELYRQLEEELLQNPKPQQQSLLPNPAENTNTSANVMFGTSSSIMSMVSETFGRNKEEFSAW